MDSFYSTSLDVFRRETGPYRILPKHKETKLRVLAKDGSVSARNELVRAYGWFAISKAVSAARRAFNTGRVIELDDLVSAATFGLMIAAQKQEPNSGARFLTYAEYWIKSSIRREIECFARPISLQSGAMQAAMKIANLDSCGQSSPTIEEMVAEIGMPRRKVASGLSFLATKVSLNYQIGDNRPLAETIPDKGPKSDRGATIESERAFIERVLDSMSPKHALAMRLRFGIGTGWPLSSTETGEIVGYTKTRIDQIIRINFKALVAKALMREGRMGDISR